MSGEAYHQTRLPYDHRREILWRALWKFHFSRYITSSDCVLELGCGYADFINNVQTRRRIALDSWPGFMKYLAKDVEGHIGDATDLSFLERASVDFAFASNVFEHLTKESFSSVLSQLSEKLTSRGKLAILQPNYRYAYKEYFDDYTHVSVYSHESLCDFLAAHNYQVIECVPRFMPLTVKNRKMIVSESLIRLYLSLPIKPLGKQMFVLARPIAQSVQPVWEHPHSCKNTSSKRVGGSSHATGRATRLASASPFRLPSRLVSPLSV